MQQENEALRQQLAEEREARSALQRGLEQEQRQRQRLEQMANEEYGDDWLLS